MTLGDEYDLRGVDEEMQDASKKQDVIAAAWRDVVDEAAQNAAHLRKTIDILPPTGQQLMGEDLEMVYGLVGEPGQRTLYRLAMDDLLDDAWYNAEAVRAFVEETDAIEDDGVGLSAIINACLDNSLQLPGLGDTDKVGYWNRKDVTVEGDVGAYAGMRMREGTLTIEGRAGDGLGQDMRGGRIEVYGGVEGEVGRGMRGGEIVFHDHDGYGDAWRVTVENGDRRAEVIEP